VPTSHGCDPTGHVGVVGHRPGVELQQVPDDQWVAACRRAGVALRRLHESNADLDRTWTVDDEVAHLRSMSPAHLHAEVDRVAADAELLAGAPLVPSHRDCHPRQLVVHGDHVAWIDLDDCTMAPAALDVGNMLAHLTREAVVGRREAAMVAQARNAFLDGYGGIDRAHCRRWERLSLVRLAGLAETRHHSPNERDALLHELEVTIP
jgi:Ser/Thr protein kinase RdoA (MazF antagonist)